MKKTFLSLALLSGLAGTNAYAADVSYTFLEGGYANNDGVAHGGYLGGSYALNNQFYLAGQYAGMTVNGIHFHYQPAELGLGWHTPVCDRADVLLEAAAVHVSSDVGDASGYRVAVGLRGNLSKKWEGLVKLGYTDVNRFDRAAVATVGAQYKFNDTWGLAGDVHFDVDHGEQTYQAGVRASF